MLSSILADGLPHSMANQFTVPPVDAHRCLVGLSVPCRVLTGPRHPYLNVNKKAVFKKQGVFNA